MDEDEDGTEALLGEQERREQAERRLAEETGEHAHERRADKHAYLREKLAEREKSEDG
jgi:glucose-6-phosphate isomerase